MRSFRQFFRAALGAAGPRHQWLRKLYPALSLRKIQTKLLEHAEAERTGRLLTLHYPPSYKSKPRWGHFHPLHQGIKKLFDRDSAEHEIVFRGLVNLLPEFRKIRKKFADDGAGEPGWGGGIINAIDGALVYYFVKKYRPRNYVEIGSGLTTLFAARAKRDHQLATRIISIDPNPRADVDARCDQVVRKPLELCDLSIFDRLEPGDIVFMDGSHISAMNSDVTVFMLDVIPNLKPGVIVQIHDIHLPFDYSEKHVGFFWNEQYIVGAYLLGAADRIKILIPPPLYAADSARIREVLRPLIDSGLAESENHWYWGGSLWFTHLR